MARLGVVETISPLAVDEIEEFVRAHIVMQAATYAHLACGDFSGLLWDDFERRVEQLARRLAGPADGGVDLVARNPGGGIVGLAQTRVGVEDWELESDLDGWVPPAVGVVLKSLFTMPGTQGAGLGRRLLDAALPGRAPAYLWVMTANTRAVRFYERNGFAPDGVAGISHGWGEMAMQRMVRF